MFYSNNIKKHICILLFAVTQSVVSLTCLKCDSTIKPKLCTEVEQCGPHEVCTTEAYVAVNGAIRYRVGCKDRLFCVSTGSIGTGKRDAVISDLTRETDVSKDRKKKDVLVCSECCDDALCNSGGCGTEGFDPSFGPVCYSCPTQIGAAGCSHIQQCGRDQICFISSLTLPGETNAYTSSCEHPKDCKPLRIPGTFTCSACCNESLCNSFNSGDEICNYHTDSAVSSTLTSLTSSVATPTVTQTPTSEQVTSTSASTSKSSTSTLSTLTPVHTTVSTNPVSTTEFLCDKCNHFTPNIVCRHMTPYLQDCIQNCAFKCP